MELERGPNIIFWGVPRYRKKLWSFGPGTLMLQFPDRTLFGFETRCFRGFSAAHVQLSDIRRLHEALLGLKDSLFAIRITADVVDIKVI
jgi:hypothetical protein